MNRKELHTVQKTAEGESVKETRASPKSQILILQSALARMFLGFRSLWKTCAIRHTTKQEPKDDKKQELKYIYILKKNTQFRGKETVRAKKTQF